ncbi:MAG: 30S ribosomal protein S9 [Verrucomicrobiaceae bacterium]|nr:30S ribosomal protein S9 [Verrucomicrobiaceae bacterium]
MSKTETIKSTGRRKTAVARVNMTPGTGQITINNEPMEDVFPTVALQNSLIHPLQVANQPKSWDLNVTTNGGGVTGQVGAVRLAIARALLKNDPELRATFREEGLLTRDARKKERKKAGQPGARKRFQFSKR